MGQLTAPMRAELFKPPTQFRSAVVARFLTPANIHARKLRLSPHQLMSEVGNFSKADPDPLQQVFALRDFHQRHVLRIVDLYKLNGDSVEVAQQMADLRKVLTIQVFRLAALENRGNYALGIGGSVIKGDHTLLTDVDAVVISHSDADREAAQRVQVMMGRILRRLYIQPDSVMPMRFDALPFDALEAEYSLHDRLAVDPLVSSLQRSNHAFYRFSMDVQIVDARGRVKAAWYREEFQAFQQRVLYENPDNIIEVAREAFEDKEAGRVTGKKTKSGTFNIKKHALRPLQFALYAIRAKCQITTASPWEALTSLEERGIVSGAEKEKAFLALRYFLSLRHLFGFLLLKERDSKEITPKVRTQLANFLRVDEKTLTEQIRFHQNVLLEISEKIFKYV